jgi:hypothetical protein
METAPQTKKIPQPQPGDLTKQAQNVKLPELNKRHSRAVKWEQARSATDLAKTEAKPAIAGAA